MEGSRFLYGYCKCWYPFRLGQQVPFLKIENPYDRFFGHRENQLIGFYYLSR